MDTSKKLDIDKLRHDFAQRINELIEGEEGPQKLENFSKKVGISMRQLSQWKNPRHINWPSTESLIRMSVSAGISVDWLLFGDGGRYSSIKRRSVSRSVG